MASQITSLAIVYSDFYSGVDQRKHQSSASLAFLWGIHRDRWLPRTKGQLRGKCFHLMTSSWVSTGSDNGLMPSDNVLSVLMLTHWGRVTHICVNKLPIFGSDNGLSPGRRQAIIWTNAGILLIGPLGTNFSEILIVSHTFSFKKMHLKMSSAKWRSFCLGLNVLKMQNKYELLVFGHTAVSCNLSLIQIIHD